MFPGILGTLISKPDDAIVGVGSAASFVCRSTIPNGISWHFTPDFRLKSLNLTDGMMLPSLANVSISHTANQTDVLILQGVGKQDTGTIACVDDRDTSYAVLTVVGK